MQRKCNCCFSKEIITRALNIDGYFICTNCGLLFNERTNKISDRTELINHYSNVDPHKKVALAKKELFKSILDFLEAESNNSTKNILDVGCGFGYFLEMATKSGWNTFGVEISEKAAKGAKEKIGNSKVFHGTLREANFDDNRFDALTLWDVLFEIEDPFDEMKECYRIINYKGKIVIRVRNLFFQKIAYRFYKLLKKIKMESVLKEPFVFHKYCFSHKSIYLLLYRVGFKNIHIKNSPLTDGDPYQYVKYYKITNISKIFCRIISGISYWLSQGRIIIGPSLLIWAEKPSK